MAEVGYQEDEDQQESEQNAAAPELELSLQLPEGLPEQSSTDKETKDNSVEVASHQRLESLNHLTQQLVGQKRQSIQMSLPTSLPKIQKTDVMAAPSKFQKTENI